MATEIEGRQIIPGKLEWVDEDDRMKRLNREVSIETSIYRRRMREILNSPDFELNKVYVLDAAAGITFFFKTLDE